MKNFLTKTTKFTNIRVFFAPIVLLFIGILFLSVNIKAQSPLDSFNPNPSAAIRAVVVQPDGKIIIGGDFTSMPGLGIKHIARLNPDGSVDSSFAPNPNYPVYTIALQPDGKIIAGGSFTTVWGDNSYRVSRHGIARFNANGTLDNTFDPNPDSTVRSITVQPNGKIIIGGSFTTVAPNYGAAVTRNRIARLNADGTLDASFDPNVDGIVNAAAVQTDGKIIIAGGFNTVTPNGGTVTNRERLARLNADGTLDASFDLGLSAAAYSIAIQSDGKFIVGGFFTDILTNGSPTATRKGIARFNVDGTLDTAFNTNITYGVFSVAIQLDGKILVGGNFTSVAPNGGAPVTRNNFARINMDGTLDTVFNPNINARVYSIAVQTDGKIVFGGDFTQVGVLPRNNIHRLEKSGVPEIMMTQQLNNPVLAIAVQTDGKILIGGDFTNVYGTTRNRIARLTADSQLDAMFNPNVNGSIYAIAVQPDGKILIGGDFTTVGGLSRSRIARLNENGSVDNTFYASANNSVRAFAVQLDGKILVGGAFTNASGLARNYIARILANGMTDNTFNANANNYINTITTLPNGQMFVGGDFTNIGGMAKSYVARLNANGTNDYTFQQSINGSVSALAIQSDGKIMIGGNFTTISGNSRPRIARLNTSGTLDHEFYTNLNAAPSSIAVQSDGLVLIGGAFTYINNQPRGHIARLNYNGSIDMPFNPDVNAPVRTIALQSDGKILIGGAFSYINGQQRLNFARLTNTAAALSTLYINPMTVILTRSGAATQFSRLIFEQSLDNGVTWTMLGTSPNGSADLPTVNDRDDASANPFSPTSIGYAAGGLNIPIGQNVLIRARGFYRAGEKNGSETVEDKIQNVFLSAPTEGKVSVMGMVVAPNNAGLRNVFVQMTLANGETRTFKTTAFGYFLFDEIPAGQTVTISVTAKNYSFSSQTIYVGDNISGLVFVSN